MNCEGSFIGETECLCERMNNVKSSIRQANSIIFTIHATYKRNSYRCVLYEKMCLKIPQNSQYSQ